MKTAVVTGGSKGIGRATCERLAGDWHVAVGYHTDTDAAGEVVDAVEDAGTDARALQVDLANPQDAAGLVEAAIDEFGRVDALVNNAGVFYDAALAEYDQAMYDRTFGVNIDGVVHATRAAVAHMREHAGERDVAGRVVGVTSTAGIHGGPKDAVYAASKGALVAFVKSIARAHADDGILANIVAPGPTDTGMLPAERKEMAANAIPLGRVADPDEVADAIEYCLEATFTTGQVVEVNGGLYT